jgi:hypothetical protein
VVLEDVPEWDVTVVQFHQPALRKVVSMDSLVRRLCGVFLQGIEGILEALCEGMTCPDAEVMIKACCDELATSVYSAYIEEVNRQLYENPKAREGWNVVRTDKRSILSLMGEVEFSRAY